MHNEWYLIIFNGNKLQSGGNWLKYEDIEIFCRGIKINYVILLFKVYILLILLNFENEKQRKWKIKNINKKQRKWKNKEKQKCKFT